MTKKEFDGVYRTGEKSLTAFGILMDQDYTPMWFHEKIAEKLERVERGEIRRLLIEMPPRHGKSQLATINFPAWYLGRNPTKEIITASYNDALAQEFGGKTRDLVASESYQHIFQTRLRVDSQSRARWETQDGGTYSSVGVGGSLTGRGASVILLDDPVKNREEAESETYRKRVWDWYTSTVRTRLEKDGAIICITTRWHLDDLVGRILTQEASGGEEWEKITFPAIATRLEPNRAIGDPLWPEKYTLKELLQVRKTIGERDWLSLYQQTPVAGEFQEFKQEYFRYFEEDEIRKKQLFYYTFVDLAISKRDSADNTVVRTIGKERDTPNIYLIDETAGHFDPFQTIEHIFTHYKRYKPTKVGVESNGYQESLAYFLEEEQRKRGMYFTVERIRNTAEKEARIRGLTPFYRAGVMFHRRSDRELEAELLQFPVGRFDDRIDALAGAVELLSEFGMTSGKVLGASHTKNMGEFQDVITQSGEIKTRMPKLIYQEKDTMDWRNV